MGKNESFLYFLRLLLIRFSLSAIDAVDEDGRIPDIRLFKVVHGLVLVMIISIIIYVDTRTRTYFF